ncbi:MAG TPA: ATP-grasp domain-containing protein [Thermoleophilia bacterium]|nr:ATP-grasp domain-containing protein [Thermoleophilia bacterium]
MSLRPLKLVLTATGCPGASTLIRMLKANGERELAIFGVDTRADAIGRFLCDGFETVPSGASDDYVPAMLRIVEREHPDVLFVQSSYEVGPIARNRHAFERLGARTLVATPAAVVLCNDKAATHAALLGHPVRQPRLLMPKSLNSFIDGAHKLGYPDAPVCFKPPVSKGSRGFRILRSEVDKVHRLLHERPNDLFMTLDEFVSLFAGVEPFPTLMLMEYVEGGEFTVDALVDGGEIVLAQVKTREAIDTGLAMSFRTVDRPDLLEAARHICRALALDWFANIQFKGDHLLEVNPRVSTFVYQKDFILPYLGIKYALGELDREEIAAAQARVRTSRRTVRYYDQTFWDVVTAPAGTP